MPKTFVAFASAQYKVDVDIKTATLLHRIWGETFPEMPKYLSFIKKDANDVNHGTSTITDKFGDKKKMTWKQYTTPMGLHRARTTFCAAANGLGLQSPSAEGAGLAVIEIQKQCYTTNDSILSRVGHETAPVKCALFIHDEILGQFLLDGKETERVQAIQKIMKEKMEIITPDVTAGTEPAAMLAWHKMAEDVWEDGKLIPWMPKEEDETKKLEG